MESMDSTSTWSVVDGQCLVSFSSIQSQSVQSMECDVISSMASNSKICHQMIVQKGLPQDVC